MQLLHIKSKLLFLRKSKYEEDYLKCIKNIIKPKQESILPNFDLNTYVVGLKILSKWPMNEFPINK
jgi:hypothetical protein